MSRQTYGVQVGSETYSVVVTDDDWEKRKLERDRQKRLSQETNRRRKALEERKKVAEEREARKRALQLSKRRQRQTEATERYQRAHLPPQQKPKKQKAVPNHKKMPLDDVLHHLRSGSPESNSISRNKQNFASTEQTSSSRSKFESKLEEEQQRIFLEHQQTTEKEFHEISGGSSPTLNLHNSPYHSSNFWDSIDYSMNRNGLQRDNAALFVKNEGNNSSQTSSPIDYNQMRLEDADDAITSPIPQTAVSQKIFSTTAEQKAIKTENQVKKESLNENQPTESHFQDDQDLLHGSSDSSVTSSYVPMTSFHQKYADDVDYAQKPKTKVKVQSSSSTSNNTNISSLSSSIYYTAPSQTSASPHTMAATSQQTQVSKSPLKVSSPATYSPWAQQYEAGPQKAFYESQAQSSLATRMASDYYVKSFRPSSAGASNTVGDPASFKPRPKSAISHHSTNNLEPTKIKASYAAKEDARMTKKSEPVVDSGITNAFTKPNATPISVLYSDAWKKPGKSFPIFTQPKLTTYSHSTGSPSIKVSSKPNSSRSSKSDLVTSNLSPEKDTHTLQSNVALKKAAEVIRPSSGIHKMVDSTPVSSSSGKLYVKLSNVKKDAEIDENASDTVSPTEANFKSILRKVSKYDVPMYHTAAAAARQKWMDNITATSKPSGRSQSARLARTEVRDSLEVARNDRPRPKSVRWHKIHYNDGTSATLTDTSVTPASHVTASFDTENRPIRSMVEKSIHNRPSSAGKSRPKPPGFNVNKQQKPPKGGKGRKLKMSQKPHGFLSPKPPSVKAHVPFTSTAVHTISRQSSSSPNGAQSNPQGNGVSKHRIAWGSDERNAVTMENLKSSGSPPSNGKTIAERLQHQFASSSGSPTRIENGHDSSFNLNRTPTDQEINWLWNTMQTCISQRPNTEKASSSRTFGHSRSDHSLLASSPYNSQSNGGTQPRSASVVSIDGNMFVNNEVQSRSIRMNRPSSAVVTSAKKRLNTYNASIRRQALLQQRRNKQLALERMKQNISTPRRYPSPKMSYFDPLPSPSSQTTGSVDESTAAFLLAETLAEQNMSEDQILKAMESLQKKTKDAQSHNAQVNPNALSMEEQRLLKSLERLNMRLHEVEKATSTNPNVSYLLTSFR